MKTVVPTLGAAFLAAAASPSPAAAQSACVSVEDVSFLQGSSDPCGFDNWYLRAIVHADNGGQSDAPFGSVTVRNSCTGSYTDCSGNFHWNGEYYSGSKILSSSIWPVDEAVVWWTIFDKELYMEGCDTPQGEQGWNPQLITRSWVAGYVRVYCN